MPSTTSIGIDGCPAGWFIVREDATGISSSCVTDLASFLVALPAGTRVCIDIPIGLVDKGTDVRECDSLARKVLGRRHSCVFNPPAREALSATTYEDAAARNRASTGKSISHQCWGITPKIAEVDRIVRSKTVGHISLREIHPEVCFTTLAGRGLAFPKKSVQGFREREAILSAHLPGAPDLIAKALVGHLRKHVSRDDVVDALVALIVARYPPEQCTTLPAFPPLDSEGLPMEMVLPPSHHGPG